MKPRNPAPGKIMVHGAGTGGVDDADIERRANELASIAGRKPTKEDHVQARRELLGQTLSPNDTENTPPSARGVTRDPSEPLSDVGDVTPERDAADEEAADERLAEDGVEEAQHDQMIAARRKERREDRKGG
ncbi:MAG TPA: hypothetical protein VFJ90_11610 [Candidatus Didemnitutus sp.]|nr:hypothetical protein [Candidatus Didemnitutus sp.]